MKSISFLIVSIFLILSACTYSTKSKPTPLWVEKSIQEIKGLEKKLPGELGVYVLNLKNGEELNYKASQFWYLSSTTKIPVAIALLKLVDQNKLKLTEKVTITKQDYRDGAGSVNWLKPGYKVSYEYLLNKMLTLSDNAATDLIIKRVGIKKVNEIVTSLTNGRNFGMITSLLDVRKQAYSQFHPKAEKLSNLSFLEIKKKRTPRKRLDQLAKELKISRKDLKFQNLNAGFEKYYATKLNSAHLTAYGELLKGLAQRSLLSPKSTEKLIHILSNIKTGKKRISLGLPKKTNFAHKTGTQNRRACDVGIATNKQAMEEQVLILVCTKKWNKLSEAERMMAGVAKILSKTSLLNKK